MVVVFCFWLWVSSIFCNSVSIIEIYSPLEYKNIVLHKLNLIQLLILLWVVCLTIDSKLFLPWPLLHKPCIMGHFGHEQFLFSFLDNEEACDIEVTWLITWCDVIGLEGGRRIRKMTLEHIEYTWWPWDRYCYNLETLVLVWEKNLV